MPIQSSVGAGGVNRNSDTWYIQELLNRQTNPSYRYGKIVVDGLVGPQTIGAISDFQRTVVGMPYPDGRVDPGYQTIAFLEKGNGSNGQMPSAGGVCTQTNLPRLQVRFRHGPRPEAGKYESIATFYGASKLLTVAASIYPDDMKRFGRIQDGTYRLWLGFHGNCGADPNEKNDFRYKPHGGVPTPVLVVNRNNRVPIMSDSAGIRSSENIHIHRGWDGERGSNGCLTIAPPNWQYVLKALMDAYPNFDDWTGEGGNAFLGQEVGTLEVTPQYGWV